MESKAPIPVISIDLAQDIVIPRKIYDGMLDAIAYGTQASRNYAQALRDAVTEAEAHQAALAAMKKEHERETVELKARIESDADRTSKATRILIHENAEQRETIARLREELVIREDNQKIILVEDRIIRAWNRSTLPVEQRVAHLAQSFHVSKDRVLAVLRDAGLHPLAIEPEKESPKFKVGDRVRLTDPQCRYYTHTGVVEDGLLGSIEASKNTEREGEKVRVRLDSGRAFLEHADQLELAPDDGAFLSDAEDRELVAMGRELHKLPMMSAPHAGQYHVGSICGAAKQEIKFMHASTPAPSLSELNSCWRDLYGPEVVPTITAANRALLRRVRRERAEKKGGEA